MRAEEDQGSRELLADLSVAHGPRPAGGRARRRSALVRRLLAASDLLALAFAFLLAQLVAGGGPALGRGDVLAGVMALPVWLLGAHLYGLYDRDRSRPEHSGSDDLSAIFHLVTVGTWLAFAGVAVAQRPPSVAVALVFWALAVVLLPVGRSLARCAWLRQGVLQNAVIVGSDEVGQLIARKFVLRAEYGVNVVGFVDTEPRELHDDLDHLALLGSPDDLPTLIRLFDIERVVIAFWDESDERALALTRTLRDLDVEIDIAPRLFDAIGPSVRINNVAGFPLVGLPSLRLSRSARLTKRAMDVVVSAVALVIFAPVFVLVAALIKIESPGQVFFRQVRMGARDKVFSVYKFRTMVVDAEARKAGLAHLNEHVRSSGDARLFKVADDPRVTRVGRVLRRYFLDELPQLLNVLKGEMSLVGPRPLVLDEDRHVDGWARRRLDLRPGMTGLWQVLGHRAIPFGEMIKLDYLYVTTWSLRNDLRLIGRTIPMVLRGGGGTF